MINRRMFLKSSGLALVAGGLLPNVFVKMANAATTKGKKVLVAIFQRGAVDGLNVIVPHGEGQYYAARPTIAIPRPGSADGAALDLDGFFGAHPSLASIVPYFKDRSAAFVHAVGSPDVEEVADTPPEAPFKLYVFTELRWIDSHRHGVSIADQSFANRFAKPS